MKGPASLIDNLAARGYHPRSDAHSNAICVGLLDDILDHCPVIRAKAARGELVARINHTVIRGHERWNLDMATVRLRASFRQTSERLSGSKHLS